MGASSLVSMLTGALRNKFIALLLGPAGMGLFGILSSTLSTASTIFTMGLGTSGIREIAQAAAANDQVSLSATRNALSVSSIVFGLLGALIFLIFCRPIAQFVMASSEYSEAIAVLGIGVWASVIFSSQIASLNGLRRLGDLTRVNVIASFSGMAAAILAVYLWDTDGVIVAVVSQPVLSLTASWWFTYRIKEFNLSGLTWQNISKPIRNMVSLGAVFLLTGSMTIGTQLLVRTIILRSLGIDATGQFQAAWSISMLYLGFVLGAMGADYYPRLVRVARDQHATNAMVNEQAEMAVLLSAPVLVVMLIFSRQVIFLLYSSEFVDAISILRWQVMGDFFKLASWPLSFVLVAQGHGRTFLLTEFSGNLVYVGSVWMGLVRWGVDAAGIGYFMCYALYFFLLWSVVYLINGFKWTRSTLKLLTVIGCLTGLVFCCSLFNFQYSFFASAVLTVLAAVYSSIKLYTLLRSFSSHGNKR
jgi:enterobacterial common antigen flippase